MRCPPQDDMWPTVVVPAYNESGRIEGLLRTLQQVRGLAEILVVDDGSEDDTAAAVRRQMTCDPRLRLIRLQTNQGKGAALAAGADAALSELVVLLDGDLVGLRPEHVEALVQPVAAGRCEMSVALFRHGRLYTDLSHILTPGVSGERCLHWRDFRDAADLRRARYGAEMVLEHHARRARLRL